jgi:head-tail adaptor
MPAGTLDKRVTFRRRSLQAANVGNERGGYADVLTCWAQFSRTSGRETVEGGRAVDVGEATLRIRSSSTTRAITAADRVLVDAKDYAIVSVSPTMRRGGWIEVLIASHLA